MKHFWFYLNGENLPGICLLSPEMAESDLINDALSEGVEVNPPVHEVDLFLALMIKWEQQQ